MTYGKLTEWQYIYDNFQVTTSELDIDKSKHTTIIYVYAYQQSVRNSFNEFGDQLYGSGLITHSQYKIEVDGLRFLFKSRDTVLKGGLRGYDKRETLIINCGGL